MTKKNIEEKIQITKDGLEEIKKEYDNLLNGKRPMIVRRLSEARSAGDLSENSEYIQAKQELSFIDGRVSELEEVISRVEVIDGAHDCCKEVGIGCKVTVKTGKGDNCTFHIVGEWEANPMAKKISYASPLGKCLMAKKVGDEIEVDAPVGKIVYKVTEIN